MLVAAPSVSISIQLLCSATATTTFRRSGRGGVCGVQSTALGGGTDGGGEATGGWLCVALVLVMSGGVVGRVILVLGILPGNITMMLRLGKEEVGDDRQNLKVLQGIRDKGDKGLFP